ncbi:MAG: Uncharacterized protein G01um10147_992 [Microgenomates group bacterium Gr01-1014_7]|nr:MAG: Uncharacterized protein G01um10147_992 [Microgenomates group bacterium Gr01-1014_7]
MKNLRFFKLWFLIAIKFIKRNYWWFIGLAILIPVAIFVQVKFNLFYNPNTISLGLIGTYQEHDLPFQVTKLISEGLVKVMENGHVKPNLVSGWEVNNDATSFKFKIKPDLQWADGSPVRSQDLVFEIPNVDVSIPDEVTAQFSLKEAYSPFPSLLIKPILKHGSMLGTGPYKITRIEKSRIFITKLKLKPLDSKLPIIYIRFYPNEKVAITGFNLGEVQALLGFSNSKAFSQNPKVAILQKQDFSRMVSVLFNTKDTVLASRSLRQALAFISPQISGEDPADSPYPHTLWAYNPDSKKYLSNPDEAKSALERAKSNLSDEALKGEIILTATPNLEEVGNLIIKEWKSLGLNAKLRIESGIPQNFQALLITQSIPSDPDQYVLWHATQTKTNLTKYDSKRVDKDLEDGRKIITEEERRAKYFDFQKTLLEDAPAVFLYFPKYNIAYLKKKEAVLNKILPLTSH